MNYKGIFNTVFLLFISSTSIIAEESYNIKTDDNDNAKRMSVSQKTYYGSKSFDEAAECRFSIQPLTNSLIINFDHVRGASKYEIRYSSSPSQSKWKSITSGFTRVEISKLNAGQTYHFQGRILNKSKWTKWSAIQISKTATFAATVVSYNVLSANFDHVFPENVWDTRKQAMVKLLKDPCNQPDIMGLQEVMDSVQLKYLQKSLNSIYDLHISKRIISPRAIFWKKNIFKLIDFDDDFFLNKADLDEINDHYISCIKLREISTNKDFLVFNVHLPSSYSSDKEALRNDFAKVLSNKVIKMSSEMGDLPVIVLGDFNSLPLTHKENKITAPMILKNSGFSDVFNQAIDRKSSEYATHDLITTGVSSSFSESLGQSKRIDYIFTYPAHRIAVSEYKVIIEFEKSSGLILRKPIPSDHRPVSSTLHFIY